MMRETLSQTDLLELPMLAFAIFLVTFMFVVARVMTRGRANPQDEALRMLPLLDDAHPEHSREP